MILRERRARLHRHACDAVVLDIDTGRVVGPREGGIDRRFVAALVVDVDVVGNGIPHRGGAGGHRFARVSHHRQRLELECDEFGGVPGLAQGLGDDEGEVLADAAHLVGDDRPLRREPDVGAVAVGELRVAGNGISGQRLQAIGQVFSAGQHCEHARRCFGLRRVDPLQARMRIRRTQDVAIDLARNVVVVAVAPASGQQVVIFDAANRLADS